jgi:hypothetical protein
VEPLAVPDLYLPGSLGLRETNAAEWINVGLQPVYELSIRPDRSQEISMSQFNQMMSALNEVEFTILSEKYRRIMDAIHAGGSVYYDAGRMAAYNIVAKLASDHRRDYVTTQSNLI